MRMLRQHDADCHGEMYELSRIDCLDKSLIEHSTPKRRMIKHISQKREVHGAASGIGGSGPRQWRAIPLFNILPCPLTENSFTPLSNIPFKTG
jgi:hypothetical protein